MADDTHDQGPPAPRKRGRPANVLNGVRGTPVTTWVTESDAAKLSTMAKHHGESVSGLLRRLVLRLTKP